MLKKTGMPHPGHQGHLCYLVNVGYLKADLKKFKDLVRDGNYICKNCGRVAASQQNLCNPIKI